MFEMDDQELSDLVGAGLEAILSGRVTLDAFIAQHPEHAAALRLELDAALWLVSRREEVAPRPGFIPASRKRVLARIQEESRSSGARRSIFGFFWPQRPAVQWAAALLALILIFSGTGGMVGLAQSALPGDLLYGVKRASESVAYSLTVGELDRVTISASFTQRRLDEAETLMAREKYQVAEQALQGYEEQVAKTVSLMEGVGEVNGEKEKEKQAVAASVEKNLEAQAVKLSKLGDRAPASVQERLRAAEQKAKMGAVMVSDEAHDLLDPTSTATPEPTSTLTATASPTPLPSSTSTDLMKDKEKTKEAREDQKATQENAVSTPGPKLPPEKKATHTPRPTNDNRPNAATPPGKPEDKPPRPQRTKDK